MKKLILITIAIASLSTTALAGHRTHVHHVVMGTGVNPVLLNANASLNGNGSGSDHAMHIRNIHDSGYNPKNDINSLGNVSVAQ